MDKENVATAGAGPRGLYSPSAYKVRSASGARPSPLGRSLFDRVENAVAASRMEADCSAAASMAAKMKRDEARKLAEDEEAARTLAARLEEEELGEIAARRLAAEEKAAADLARSREERDADYCRRLSMEEERLAAKDAAAREKLMRKDAAAAAKLEKKLVKEAERERRAAEKEEQRAARARGKAWQQPRVEFNETKSGGEMWVWLPGLSSVEVVLDTEEDVIHISARPRLVKGGEGDELRLTVLVSPLDEDSKGEELSSEALESSYYQEEGRLVVRAVGWALSRASHHRESSPLSTMKTLLRRFGSFRKK
eukprot:PLAT8851.1.p1 GENE.PLAT8851.1~~PLAT8851.1.p1  ORF type:complete len:311 (-),score=172.82 PLAT8851.1:114-1046(-)